MDMKFLQTVQNSIYSPQFYPTILKKSFKSSFGYFLLLILLLTVINLLFLIKPILIETPKAVEKISQDVINCFPKDLKIKISNGQVSINQKEPYFVSSCQAFDQKKNLAVIDTKTAYSAAQFAAYQTQTWVTKDAIVFKRNNFETRTYSLEKVKDFQLDQDVIYAYQKMFLPLLKFVGPVLLLLSFVGIFLAYDFRLLHLLLLASLIWLLGKLFKFTLTYGQSYKLGLHAITLGLIVELLANLTSRWTNFHGFPFMVSILTLGVVIINLKPTFFSRG